MHNSLIPCEHRDAKYAFSICNGFHRGSEEETCIRELQRNGKGGVYFYIITSNSTNCRDNLQTILGSTGNVNRSLREWEHLRRDHASGPEHLRDDSIKCGRE